jgi:hypothetical protein
VRGEPGDLIDARVFINLNVFCQLPSDARRVAGMTRLMN